MAHANVAVISPSMLPLPVKVFLNWWSGIWDLVGQLYATRRNECGY